MGYGRERKGLQQEWQRQNAAPDCEGTVVAAVRMDADTAYEDIYNLLKKVIDDDDKESWNAILDKIDYIYENLDCLLEDLERETQFGYKLWEELRKGKKLLFKPNIVAPNVIDPVTHLEGAGAIACTEWPFLAALMRLFHDRYDIEYSQMALGEASSTTFLMADYFKKLLRRPISTEAVLEGKDRSFYGGYGFYFVRRYLKDRHPADHTDDPMNGYAESVEGSYVEPGRGGNRLLVYDLNKVDRERGRYVDIPDGVNFQKIMLHKVIVGGKPKSEENQKEYPGCILVNVPKCKMHAQDLLTNAVKNLGIGLYPSVSQEDEEYKYANEAGENLGLKGKLPHSTWVYEMDRESWFPKIDANGTYKMKKTGGLSATQVDMVEAVQRQGVFMIHICDAIHMINLSHDPDGNGKRMKEGFAFASLDPVALDLCCARYCFKTVPMQEAKQICDSEDLSQEFLQYVPVARIDGYNIVTKTGVDSPLLRYPGYEYEEQRGIGSTMYYVTGCDTTANMPLASIDGHLVGISKDGIEEVMTDAMYYNLTTFLHDMQNTVFSYAMASDILTETNLMRELLELFDENEDGVIDYEEKGRGIETALFSFVNPLNHISVMAPFGQYQAAFQLASIMLRNSEREWNELGHTFTKERTIVKNLLLAYEMSQQKEMMPDLFFEGMSYGQGMWPSFYTVCYISLTKALYGGASFSEMSLSSMYGNLFQYADKAYEGGRYTKTIKEGECDPNALKHYLNDVRMGHDTMNFILYVPEGYGTFDGIPIPNVQETKDRERLFHSYFEQMWKQPEEEY